MLQNVHSHQVIASAGLSLRDGFAAPRDLFASQHSYVAGRGS